MALEGWATLIQIPPKVGSEAAQAAQEAAIATGLEKEKAQNEDLKKQFSTRGGH